MQRPTNSKEFSLNLTNHQNCKNLKISRVMPILAICSLTRSLQSTGKRGFCDGTHTPPTHGHCNLETELAQCQWGNSVKICSLKTFQFFLLMHFLYKFRQVKGATFCTHYFKVVVNFVDYPEALSGTLNIRQL